MDPLDQAVSRAQAARSLLEAVLGTQAAAVQQAAGLVSQAFLGSNAVHLLGEGPLAHQAAYLAEALHRPGDGRTLPARLLAERGSGLDGYARAVEAFLRPGDALLVVSAEATPRLERAAALARGRQAQVVCLVGPAAESLGALCDLSILIPADDPPLLAEALLGVGHALWSLVQADLGPAQATAPLARSGASLSDLGVIDRDGRAPRSDDPVALEGGVLAEAVDLALTPATDPRGRPRYQVPPPAAVTTAPSGRRFRCGACGDVMQVDAQHLGRKGKCPHCMAGLQIPASGGDGPEPTPIEVDVLEAAPPTRPEAGRSRTRRRTRERRRSTRFNVRDTIVRFRRDAYPDGRTYLEANSLDDLSLTGLRFVGRPGELEIGDVLFFAIDFPAFPEPVRFKGEVRRLIPRGGGETVAAGVRFLEYVGDAEGKIRRLLEHENLRAVRRR
jgi:phosphoheptose isomerase